ncbi:MAG TPA: hypothetical protein VEI97_00215, partial [bacterium]|nr:hypothetical protein [bacterium]
MPRTPFAALPLALALLGCHSAPGTLAPAPTPPAGSLRASSEVLAARFQLTVDPATMSATAVPLPARTGTVQAISYDLALSNFMRPNTFEVAAVRYDTDGDLRIDFTHTHPFPAPDLTQPGRRANSADLGYTGRVLVLADGAPATFFGDVTLDPALVKDPDGYLRPGSVLPVPGPRNTFPYMLLADEARNNRVGVPNGGAPTGNYDPAAFGWQRANMGTGNNRWTGYDFIHHGQAIRNRITLRRSALGSTPRTFEIALVIKWTDPKATAADKLPPETPDPLKFAYRLPFATLDISAVDPSTVQIARTGGATALVGAAVRDWDALAAVSADANLSDEPNVALIQPNGDGIPAVELSAPALAP